MSARLDAERLSAVVRDSLDDKGDSNTLARRAYSSRTQFFRVFRAVIDETPAAMRRRLLLERAAWQLGRTRHSVTHIALDAGYGSLEAFTRAFRKAFRISPSLYRRMGATHFHLPAPGAIHFCAPTSLSAAASAKVDRSEGDDMDLYDMFAGAESFHVRKLLEHARALRPEQLDAPLGNQPRVFPWDSPAQSLRDLLRRLVQTKEIWTAALNGGSLPDLNAEAPEQGTPDALLARLEKADAEFSRILGDVRKRNAWGDTFVDALCEPPETFSFGGMFAHVITFNTYQRLLALDALRRMGVKVEGFGCPTEYEASLAAVK
ncbi:MAG TPA: helix-turn-helix domain-containing protein [Vicinamibacterales bacterium]|nr:helix-turn-helix domain-containing protein [Vicinamibacterales bacterium]